MIILALYISIRARISTLMNIKMKLLSEDLKKILPKLHEQESKGLDAMHISNFLRQTLTGLGM